MGVVWAGNDRAEMFQCPFFFEVFMLDACLVYLEAQKQQVFQQCAAQPGIHGWLSQGPQNYFFEVFTQFKLSSISTIGFKVVTLPIENILPRLYSVLQCSQSMCLFSRKREFPANSHANLVPKQKLIAQFISQMVITLHIFPMTIVVASIYGVLFH